MMRTIRGARLLFTVWAALLGTQVAGATPFWIAYEGDDYPENQGWERVYGDEHGPNSGGAIRSLADGIFTEDSLHDDQIFDFYER